MSDTPQEKKALDQAASANLAEVNRKQPAPSRNGRAHKPSAEKDHEWEGIEKTAPVRKSAEGSRARKSPEEKEESQATKLLALCSDMELFHDGNSKTYASLEVNGIIQSHRVYSQNFKDALSYRLYRTCGEGVMEKTFATVLPTLHARALHDGKEQSVAFRTAGEGKTHIEIDLGNDQWDSIRIERDAETWEIVPHQSSFVRSSSMHAMPYPIRGGSLAELRRFVPNIYSDSDFALLLAWTVTAMYPVRTMPYPILVLRGEQGSGKSSVSRLLQKLVDPSETDVQTMFTDPRDVPAAADNAHVLAFDNVDRISSIQSDTLCRMSTGAGIGNRELYSNTNYRVVYAHRPLILNGIGEFAVRGDLLDRCLMARLSPISEDQRRTEAELKEEWEEAWARIFGALLDALHLSLKRRDEIHATLKTRVRMADFAEVAIATEPAFEVPEGTVIAALSTQRAEAYEQTLESPLPVAIRQLMVGREVWERPASELLKELTALAFPDGKVSKFFPGDATRLSSALEKLGPALRSAGIEVARDKSNGVRTLRIEKLPLEEEMPAVQAAPSPFDEDDLPF